MRDKRGRGRGLGGGRPTQLRGKLGRVEERSSILASLLSLAEEPFLGEVGVLRSTEPSYQTPKCGERWDEVKFSGYQTHPKFHASSHLPSICFLLPDHSYSLRPIILFANMDVSITRMCLDTSVLTKSIMGRREYLFLHGRI
jgi:hypothetical protein